jgi:hypothetical protein
MSMIHNSPEAVVARDMIGSLFGQLHEHSTWKLRRPVSRAQQRLDAIADFTVGVVDFGVLLRENPDADIARLLPGEQVNVIESIAQGVGHLAVTCGLKQARFRAGIETEDGLRVRPDIFVDIWAATYASQMVDAAAQFGAEVPSGVETT